MQALQAFAELVLIPAQLLLAMFGMGATLALKDFALVFRRPKGLALGLALQLLFVPAMALLVIELFALPPGWAVGFLLIAAAPGGTISNLLTYLGKGAVPLSIAVTTTSTLGCMVTVPLFLQLTASAHLPPDFVFPTASILRDIALYLLIPLAVGMAIYRYVPRHAERISKVAIRLSVLCIVVLVISSLGSGRIQPMAYGFGKPALVLGFALFLSVASTHVCRLFRFPDEDALALGVEVTVRNVGIGLLLVPFFFPGEEAQDHVLFACLFYSGVATPLSLPMIARNRMGRSPAYGRRPMRAAPVETADEAA